MKLHFLEADKPLTKSFAPSSKSSFPNVYEVTSHEDPCPDLATFHQLLIHHGSLGHCLLKGNLGRKLVCESRAGSTNAGAPTSWACLDLDGVAYATPDDFMAAIGLPNVSYVLQWSASASMPGTTGLRAHLFILLAQPTHPDNLKGWLQHLNLSVPGLSAGLSLNTTGMALKWPLDVTTCQNDKLLYIAPPRCLDGVVDPFPGTSRYVLRTKSQERAWIPPVTGVEELTIQAVSTQREARGLPARRRWEEKFQGSVSYLPKPDEAKVTGVRKERGFTYLNLNGGDSFAYFHPDDNPHFIYNFKGEPTYKTSELVPAYWAELKKVTGKPSYDGKTYLVFRNFTDGAYYNAIYDGASLDMAQAKSKTQLIDFMLTNGQLPPDAVPDWNVVFDPSNPDVIDPERHTINIYRPSAIAKVGYRGDVDYVPDTIARVIEHMVGGHPDTRDWVYNWLAYIVQIKKMSGCALLCHGTSGTGKGIFYHHIVTPLLGPENVTIKRLEELESEFTGWLENKLFVFVDEVQTSSSLFHARVNAKLKNLITEPTIPIRRMYAGTYDKANYANFMFASNELDPVSIKDGDRRYTVGFRQNSRLETFPGEAIKIIEAIKVELPLFYSYLMTRKVDIEAACSPLETHAKRLVIDTGRTSVESFCHALRTGDLAFFVEALPAISSLPETFPRRRQNQIMAQYVALVYNLVNTGEQRLLRDESKILAQYCVGDGVPDSPHKFTAMMRHHDLHMEVMWRDGSTKRGLNIQWKVDDTWQAKTLAEIEPLATKVASMAY